MPIYEYHCDACEQNFEQMRRITDDTLPNCPACGSGNVRKLISLSAFHLKGTGWYVTDYGGKKNGAAATAGNGNGNGNGNDSTEGKSETADTKSTSTSTSDKPSAATSTSDKPSAATSTSSTTDSKS